MPQNSKRYPMKSINLTIGENLKKIREISGFTQEQVAQFIGIERSAYSNYEGGIREVPYSVLEKISDLFGCEPYLLFEDNIHMDDEIMATAFRISDLGYEDLKEVANFKDIVKSYLKMERLAHGKSE